jgi:hypothetical protein
MLKEKTRKLKKTNFWKFFIQNIFYPIYHIFWQYILNFQAKFLYFLWISKKRSFINLAKKDSILVSNNKIFKSIANKVSNETNLLMKDSKQKILSKEYKKKLSDEIGPSSVDAEIPYRISMYENLSDELKKDIVDFGSSELMITTAAKHMGIFPILTRVQVDHVISRKNAEPRGAMFWHRDTFGFKNLDFFMAVTDIDDENGPFYYLGKKIKASTFLNFPNVVSTSKKGERGKVSLEEFSKYFKNEETFKLAGESGVGVFLDSFSTYHRGGFCKSKDRVTLRLCYQSHDALYESHLINDNIYKYDHNKKKITTNNMFKKYLFFKTKSKLMRILSKKIVFIFRKIDFIIN